MKLLIFTSIFFWANWICHVSSLQSFNCNEGEEFNSSVSLKIFYTSSLAQCGSTCNAVMCPTFAYNRNTNLCSISDNFYGSSIPSPLSTRCYIQPAPTPAAPTALPGDTGAQCNLQQSFSLYVQATGATFYCCHGWEYMYSTNRDLTYYPTILAQDCRYNCDIHPSCYSFTYYGNTTCQLSSCSNSLSCTKANVTTMDAIWCYY